jgi:hypothetical protein
MGPSEVLTSCPLRMGVVEGVDIEAVLGDVCQGASTIAKEIPELFGVRGITWESATHSNDSDRHDLVIVLSHWRTGQVAEARVLICRRHFGGMSRPSGFGEEIVRELSYVGGLESQADECRVIDYSLLIMKIDLGNKTKKAGTGRGNI